MTDYLALSHDLQQMNALLSVAEAHGILCGLLCTSRMDFEQTWLTHIVGDHSDDNNSQSECVQNLSRLKRETLQQLHDEDFEFDLLLPDDDYPLEERLGALGEWCEGFLFGVGLTGFAKHEEDMSEESKEFLNDVVKFSKVDHYVDETEENEQAYSQITEYIRVGVLTMFEELPVVH